MLQDPQVGAGGWQCQGLQPGPLPPGPDAGGAFRPGLRFLEGLPIHVRLRHLHPGALSAYRGTVIKPILEEWRQQTFMGLPANIGEDRALTNPVLRQGFFTVYQRSALVHTVVPETYRGLVRMYLRWDPQQLPGKLGAG